MQLTWLLGALSQAGFGSRTRRQAMRLRFTRHAADASRRAGSELALELLNQMRYSVFLWSALLFGLGACAPGSIPIATEAVSPTALAISGTPYTPRPTNTPVVTNVSPVTSTPRPIATVTDAIRPSVTPTVKPHDLALSTLNIQQIVQLQRFGRSYPRQVVWLPNADMIAVASSAEISIMSTTSFDVIQTLNAQTAYPAITVSSTGQRLFVAANSVQVWDLHSGQLVNTFGDIAGGIRCFAISADERLLAIAGPAWAGGGDPDYQLEIIDISSGRIIHSTQRYGIISSVAVDPIGRWVASNSERGLEMFDGQTGELLQIAPDNFGHIAFGSDGILAEGQERGAEPLRVWDARTGELVFTIDNGFGRPVFSADGQRLVLWAESGAIQIRETTAFQLVHTLEIPGSEMIDVALSSDGKTLAIVTLDGLSIWDIESGAMTSSVTSFTQPINAIAFSPEANLLLGQFGDSVAYAWDIESGTLSSSTVAFERAPSANLQSPDGQVRTEEWIDDSVYPPVGAIRLIDNNNDVIHELIGHRVVFGEGFIGLVESLAFNWDGSVLASAGYDDSIWLWDTKTGTALLTLPRQTLLRDINFSPDGRYLASGSWDGTIHLWGLPTP